MIPRINRRINIRYTEVRCSEWSKTHVLFSIYSLDDSEGLLIFLFHQVESNIVKAVGGRPAVSTRATSMLGG